MDENSQNVITATPVAATALSITPDEFPEAIALAHEVMMLEIDADEQHGAQALQLPPVHHHHSGSGQDAATAMKKSFIRKKEMTAVDEGGKKQKSKVSNTRK